MTRGQMLSLTHARPYQIRKPCKQVICSYHTKSELNESCCVLLLSSNRVASEAKVHCKVLTSNLLRCHSYVSIIYTTDPRTASSQLTRLNLARDRMQESFRIHSLMRDMEGKGRENTFTGERYYCISFTPVF